MRSFRWFFVCSQCAGFDQIISLFSPPLSLTVQEKERLQREKEETEKRAKKEAEKLRLAREKREREEAERLRKIREEEVYNSHYRGPIESRTLT